MEMLETVETEKPAAGALGTTTRRSFVKLMGAVGVAGALGMFGCSQQGTSTSASTNTQAFTLDPAAWSYDADNSVYYQIGVQYCASPQAQSYESMGIYVPGAYFTAEDNGDGTFTCAPNAEGAVGSYTAATAPIVMPINTAGYAAQAAPTEYSASGITDYLAEGFIYVYAGCRGRNLTDDACGAAPWGVTDLKAAVRALRFNSENLPGSMDRIFSFGHSGGGAQSAVLGATGDSDRYASYLEAIGAPTADAAGNSISDAIYGAMCWCPITSLTGADAAYEWNMGQFTTTDTRAEGTFTRQLSQDLAASYAEYINALGLVDEDGTELTLEDGGEGVACAGAYYDYVVVQVEQSLNNFLADTTFPYTPTNSFNADMGAGGGAGGHGGPDGGNGEAPSGEKPSGEAPSGEKPADGGPSGSEGGAPADAAGAGNTASTTGSADAADAKGKGGKGGSSDSSQETTTYETAADYIASLNGSSAWITYDEKTNTATITGLSGFVNACKQPSKSVGAFDDLSRSQAENGVFGNASNESLHFSATMANLLSANADAYAKLENWDANYPSDYATDREYTDELGTSCDARQEMYDPMTFLGKAAGAGTSTPAAHWRIRTGIAQGDTASTTELNLALALGITTGVESVDFATVWGQGHTMAERTGSSTENFIAWVNDCCK